MPREVYHSSHTKEFGWHVVKDGEVVSTHATQKDAEAAAKQAGRRAYEKCGLGQAVLHKANGTIKTEHTYGKDPEKYRG